MKLNAYFTHTNNRAVDALFFRPLGTDPNVNASGNLADLQYDPTQHIRDFRTTEFKVTMSFEPGAAYINTKQRRIKIKTRSRKHLYRQKLLFIALLLHLKKNPFSASEITCNNAIHHFDVIILHLKNNLISQKKRLLPNMDSKTEICSVPFCFSSKSQVYYLNASGRMPMP